MLPYDNTIFFIICICRQGQDASQRILFQKAKFVSFLIENFVPFEIEAPPKSTITTATVVAVPVEDISSSNSHSSNSHNSSSSHNSHSSNRDLLIRRIAVRGLIMNCANAIRLQVSSQSPNSYLSNFLNAHPKWNEFVPKLAVRKYRPYYLH